MASTTLPSTVGADCGGPDRLRRFTGRAAIFAGAWFVLQPVYVAVDVATSDGREEFLSPGNIADRVWTGALGSVIFSGVGIGLLAAVLGVGRLVRAAGTASPWWPVAHVLGVVAAGGWLLAGGLSVGLTSSVARAMGDIGADVLTERVGLHAGNVVLTGVLAAVAVASAGWLLGVAGPGRGAGVIGRPVAVVAALAAAAMVVPQLVWSQPFGVMATAPGLLAVGVAILRRKG